MTRVCFSLVVFSFLIARFPGRAADLPAAHKTRDLVIYQDPQFYCAFPSIVRRKDGELLVAFRRAPDRRAFGSANSHTDPNSYLVLVRSTNDGETWSPSPKLLFAHPFGGSQDPCMVQLGDGTLLCSSYGWRLLEPAAAAKLDNTMRHGNFAFMGGYLLRSRDGAQSWEGPIIPPHVEADNSLDVFGRPTPAFNRGAMTVSRTGTLFWAVAANVQNTPRRTETYLLESNDQGTTWKLASPIARDPKVTFNETSLYETPRGDLIAFMRTANFDDHTVMARSTDHGHSFQPWRDLGFQGHPHFALRLPDDRVLLIYGYRHPPFGIRARILDPECTNAATAPELILRDDGGNGDLGYPWATLLSDHRALVVYYFNVGDGPRFIAGTLLDLN